MQKNIIIVSIVINLIVIYFFNESKELFLNTSQDDLCAKKRTFANNYKRWRSSICGSSGSNLGSGSGAGGAGDSNTLANMSTSFFFGFFSGGIGNIPLSFFILVVLESFPVLTVSSSLSAIVTCVLPFKNPKFSHSTQQK